MQGSKAGCCTAAKQGPDAWCSAPATKGSEGGRAGLCAAALGFEVGLRAGDGGVRGGVHLGAENQRCICVFCVLYALSANIDMQRIKGHYLLTSMTSHMVMAVLTIVDSVTGMVPAEYRFCWSTLECQTQLSKFFSDPF
ncbi:unnamed protein product [Miscanthus lutarioriparius]|uniref:Uncharacterized protein n=1 Tax=Miscanthus lutarioriparius TaxID=422564 RepID=A0A811NFA5_9POAL|nr:unnamed protein product [Miscanthus lutarioriparius]